MADDKQKGTWVGRRPKGMQDTHSFKAFLRNTKGRVLQDHLARHHKGFRPS